MLQFAVNSGGVFQQLSWTRSPEVGNGRVSNSTTYCAYHYRDRKHSNCDFSLWDLVMSMIRSSFRSSNGIPIIFKLDPDVLGRDEVKQQHFDEKVVCEDNDAYQEFNRPSARQKASTNSPCSQCTRRKFSNAVCAELGSYKGVPAHSTPRQDSRHLLLVPPIDRTPCLL